MTRPYRSEVRAQQTQNTRLRLFEAASPLFAQQGWASTSVRQLSESAGVSLHTIYAAGGKAGVFLHALEIALSGTHAETPLFESPPLRDLWRTGTLPEILDSAAGALTLSNRRAAGLWAALTEGASNDAALAHAIKDKHAAMRSQGRERLQGLITRGLIAAPEKLEETVDLMWAEAHPNRYALLTQAAGWSDATFHRHLTRSFCWILDVPPPGQEPCARKTRHITAPPRPARQHLESEPD